MNNIISPKKCIGTGLVTLDIIVNNETPQDFTYFAGGSCGNVMTILSFLGWNSKPIARFSDNKMAKRIISDLSNFGVDNSLLYYSKTGVTPVILQRNYKDSNGNIKHKFEFQNPLTGEYFPRFRSILLKDIY